MGPGGVLGLQRSMTRDGGAWTPLSDPIARLNLKITAYVFQVFIIFRRHILGKKIQYFVNVQTFLSTRLLLPCELEHFSERLSPKLSSGHVECSFEDTSRKFFA